VAGWAGVFAEDLHEILQRKFRAERVLEIHDDIHGSNRNLGVAFESSLLHVSFTLGLGGTKR